MNIADMKISQIADLIEGHDLSADIAAALRTDPRSSVKRLFEKWVLRQEKKEKESLRLRELYMYESIYYESGLQLVAGIDEAGRGPLAGPVVVAAVILPPYAELPGLNDSKKLSAAQREKLYVMIQQTAVSISWQAIPVEMIDSLNIYQATIHGMYQAIAGLPQKAEAVLIDAVKLPELAVPWQAIIGGDSLSASIAAASVVAKVERDRLMNVLAVEYPGYGFDKHKGYGTKEHLAALMRFGPCPVHRRSFEPVKSRGGKLRGAETPECRSDSD